MADGTITVEQLAAAVKAVAAQYPDATVRADRPGLLDFYPTIDRFMPAAVINLSDGSVTMAAKRNEYHRTYPAGGIDLGTE